MENRCKECGRDMRTYSPFEHELMVAEKNGAWKTLKLLLAEVCLIGFPLIRISTLKKMINRYADEHGR